MEDLNKGCGIRKVVINEGQHIKRKYIDCNLCGSSEFGLLFTVDGYDIVKCSQCGLVYLNPQPNEQEIHDLYFKQKLVRSGGSEEILAAYLKDKAKFTAVYKTWLLQIEKYKNKGRLLDIGCAAGFFLNYARENGWEVKGIDISDWAISIARKELELDVIQGTLPEANFPDEYFDVVTMFDVLEHLPNPSCELQIVRRILKRDGLLVVNVPNIDSFIAKINGKHWNKLIPPQHLYHFTPGHLLKMLEKGSFKILSIKTNNGDPGEMVFSTCVGLANTTSERAVSGFVQFYRKHKGALRWLRRSFQIGAKIISFVFSPPLGWLILKLNKGEGITAFAQKG